MPQGLAADRQKPPLLRQGRLPSWCPRPESNRHDREVEGFSYHFDFRRQRKRCSWSGARLHHSLAAVGARRLLSTPSHESFDSGLGSALAQTFACPGRSPNLTGFTFGVSSGGLKLLQVPCVYQFHHSGWYRSLPSPFSPDYCRACSNCTARLAPSWLLAIHETNSHCMPESLEIRTTPSFLTNFLAAKKT